MMTETVVAVEPSQNPEDEAAAAALIDVPNSRQVDELEVARELVRQAREAGVALTGPGGLLKAMTKRSSKPPLMKNCPSTSAMTARSSWVWKWQLPQRNTGQDRSHRCLRADRDRRPAGSGGHLRAPDRRQAPTPPDRRR